MISVTWDYSGDFKAEVTQSGPLAPNPFIDFFILLFRYMVISRHIGEEITRTRSTTTSRTPRPTKTKTETLSTSITISSTSESRTSSTSKTRTTSFTKSTSRSKTTSLSTSSSKTKTTSKSRTTLTYSETSSTSETSTSETETQTTSSYTATTTQTANPIASPVFEMPEMEVTFGYYITHVVHDPTDDGFFLLFRNSQGLNITLFGNHLTSYVPPGAAVAYYCSDLFKFNASRNLVSTLSLCGSPTENRANIYGIAVSLRDGAVYISGQQGNNDIDSVPHQNLTVAGTVMYDRSYPDSNATGWNFLAKLTNDLSSVSWWTTLTGPDDGAGVRPLIVRHVASSTDGELYVACTVKHPRFEVGPSRLPVNHTSATTPVGSGSNTDRAILKFNTSSSDQTSHVWASVSTSEAVYLAA